MTWHKNASMPIEHKHYPSQFLYYLTVEDVSTKRRFVADECYISPEGKWVRYDDYYELEVEIEDEGFKVISWMSTIGPDPDMT